VIRSGATGPAYSEEGEEPEIDCSVLTPVLNEERYIEETIAAMQRQRFSGRLEFLFADGGSEDRTREILERRAREDPRIRIFDNPGRSVSSGLNVALKHARGRWVARMDAHTVYPPDYVELGVTRLQQGGTRWVSGPQVPAGHNPVSRAVALALGSPLGRGGSRKWGTDGPRERAEYELDAGVFCGVFERAAVLAYGGWDERWPRNSDSEMAGRFLARGERLVCVPAMAAQYAPRDSLSGLWRQYRDYGRYRVKTARAHPHTLRRSHLLAPALVLEALAALALPGAAGRLARTGLCAYAGVTVLAGVRAWPRADRAGDALLVPVALAVMHFAFGVGALLGAAEHGIPVEALLSAIGVDALGRAAEGAADPVFAPSLR